MIEEFRKSVNSILYQRVTSPFWGALIASWLLWNWEIIYLTFFIPHEVLEVNKISYIKNYLSNNHWNIVIGPIITLVIILVFLPIISNLVYWLHLIFNNWKVNKKRVLEKKIPLSIEDSVKIRDQILKQEEIFQNLNKKNDEKILEQSNQLNELKISKHEIEESFSKLEEEHINLKKSYQRLRESDDYSKIFKQVSVYAIEKSEGIVRWKFQINSRNIVEFRREGKYKKFTIHEIKNYGSEDFEFVLYPNNSSDNGEEEIIILQLKRTANIHEFIGSEIRVIRKKNELENQTEMNNVKIYAML